MSGDAGVIEDEQAIWLVAGGQMADVGGQFSRQDGSEAAVGVVEQGDGGRGKLGAGLLQLRFAFPGQVCAFSFSVDASPWVWQRMCTAAPVAVMRLTIAPSPKDSSSG